jgi:uncharacterized spore protein YtfJ
MSAQNLLEKLGESLGSTATVKSVFGEPIHVEGKTVVPVATVMYGFGGGFGSGPIKRPEAEGKRGEGGGGGGGVRAYPAGALEITADRTRFVPFTNLSLAAAAFGLGALVGAWIVRRRR